MEPRPTFIKEFSKDESSEDRDNLAQEIKNSRREYFKSKESSEVIKLHELGDEILELSDTLPGKISEYMKYIKTRFALFGKKDKEPEDQELEAEEILDLSSSVKEAKEKIDNFYKKQKEKWINAPYSKETIEQQFSPEHLSLLNIEEYILLLKRFPSQMVTHVTRQGVRDHVGAVNHHSGVDVMSNGFKDIMKNGELKSSFSIHVTESAKNDTITDFLNLKSKTKEEALQTINYIVGEDTQHHHGSFADRKSIHFATEEVADAHYGAETGNEIFFAYPSAMIASQYLFSGQLIKANGGYHNNQWVFTDENKDLSVDAGLIFISKNSQVDRNTGSKYELDENQKPVINEKLFTEIKDLISKDSFVKFATEYAEILESTNVDIEKLFDDKNISNDPVENKIYEAVKILATKFNITNKNMYLMILDYSFLRFVQNTHVNEKEIKDVISRSLREVGLYFELAKDVVSSEDYWNEYFKDNLTKKKLKVVYYEENSPTQALKNWQVNNGLIKGDHRSDLGFVENSVNLSDAQDVQKKLPSISRFKVLAEGVVDNFYD